MFLVRVILDCYFGFSVGQRGVKEPLLTVQGAAIVKEAATQKNPKEFVGHVLVSVMGVRSH
jgi:hypothetical protein